ncbi:MAG: hypothetical protein WCX70_00740 [Candidatus Paceibacterota bacterium]
MPDWGHLGYGTLQKLSQAVVGNLIERPVCTIDVEFGEKPSAWAAFTDLDRSSEYSFYCVDSTNFSGYGYVANPNGKCEIYSGFSPSE